LRRGDDVSDDVWRFITAEAARGNWQELHQAIERHERPEDSPLNATAGDLHNIYATPP
jgi:hypothetical protein